jgi:hypothetical protein
LTALSEIDPRKAAVARWKKKPALCMVHMGLDEVGWLEPLS